ncbi:UNVERIFIED_CONTAM: FIP1[V]-like protein [Sesamum radiatum]|uniref:FIP1[V]-like protein n=1 Tax=Sesamum radiatum TaxID=300843 RepID=A0AAW2LAQ5_SESRA
MDKSFFSRTIFEVDIDGFEEKPWRLPGIDVSDFFNFGLNEDSWKDYCKRLEQLRLETSMQSKIRVYESGRAEQDYDPDLPPELAAAVGIQDVPSENANPGKLDAGPTDLARASARGRPPVPIGRPIPVETGSGDRLPSIDTRRPRMHDSDAIIEIVCQSSLEDDEMAEQQNNDPAAEDLGGVDEVDDVKQDDADRIGRFSHAYNGQNREVVAKRAQVKNNTSRDELEERMICILLQKCPRNIILIGRLVSLTRRGT